MFSLKHPSKLLLGPTSMPAPAPTPPRAIPYGCLGYTNIQRRNATINQPNHPTVRSNADLLVPSKSSVQRWNRRVAARGNPDRLGAKGFRGKFKLSRRGAFTIWWYKHTQRPSCDDPCVEKPQAPSSSSSSICDENSSTGYGTRGASDQAKLASRESGTFSGMAAPPHGTRRATTIRIRNWT
jgi:hypothetical protein